MRAGYVPIVVALLIGIGLPLVSVVDYQFGGYYTEKVYPLDKAQGWLSAAQSLVPYDPKGILADTSSAWALVNQSDNASGYGQGSPCWLWATPQESYGYVEILLAQVSFAVGYYESHQSFFSNTTITSWSQVSNALGTISNSLDGAPAGGNIGGCLFVGNEMATALLLITLILGPVLLVICLAVLAAIRY